jgi:hypothetical protein
MLCSILALFAPFVATANGGSVELVASNLFAKGLRRKWVIAAAAHHCEGAFHNGGSTTHVGLDGDWNKPADFSFGDPTDRSRGEIKVELTGEDRYIATAGTREIGECWMGRVPVRHRWPPYLQMRHQADGLL